MAESDERLADASSKLRSLPSVDRVLGEAALSEALERWPRELVLESVRAEIERVRTCLVDGREVSVSASAIAEVSAAALAERLRPSLRRVINATGVVIHTNLGRAPVSEAASRAMSEAAAGYSTLEFDLADGTRGSRGQHLESALRAVTGAEAGIAVNNNASALYFAMSAFCAGREVVVSRGQAVEIGGGFRIPDVLRDAGATLVEVGTTNRTRALDYAAAVSERTAAILRVHTSNFRVVGFAEEPSAAELREVSEAAGALLIDDVGSGCLLDTRRWGLTYEPRPQDSIAAGADLALFSGDKLLGGPQAGVIVGRRALVDELRSHPLMRVLRLDKAAIAGLSATLGHYLAGEAETAVPVWAMIGAEASELRERAEGWRSQVGAGEVEASESAIGGGALPAEVRPTYVWSWACANPSAAARSLREWETPIVARVERGRLLLDPRTVLPDEDDVVVSALRALAARER